MGKKATEMKDRLIEPEDELIAIRENIYQRARKKAKLTQEDAKRLTGLELHTIRRIEQGERKCTVEETKKLIQAYNAPELRYDYCARECPMRMDRALQIKEEDLSKITLRFLDSLNKITQSKERLISIVLDDIVDSVEMAEFVKINLELERIVVVAEELRLWTEKRMTEQYEREYDSQKQQLRKKKML